MPVMRSLRSFKVLISWMDIHQARTESTQEEMKAKMGILQEKMEATVNSIWSNLKETIEHWVEDVLTNVNQKNQRPSKGRNSDTPISYLGQTALRREQCDI
jgi:hypothetical protein